MKKKLKQSKKRIERKPEDYTSNYMTRAHIPITNMKDATKYSYNNMFLFYKGELVGEADLDLVSKRKMYLHTDGVSLEKEHRKQGHGIHLYHHLISTAIRIGCKRLYSSTILNKFSKRMWRDKLSKFYKVVTIFTNTPCPDCGCSGRRPKQFYIDLKKD
jgi:GNAT superfamily N-acetyltransferase